MHEGLVSEKLTRNVTHVVAYAEQESPTLFPAILQRFVLCTGSQFRISDTHGNKYTFDSTPVDDNCYILTMQVAKSLLIGCSLTLEERTLLLLKRVNVVNHHWIENAFSSNTCCHPSENDYELR